MTKAATKVQQRGSNAKTNTTAKVEKISPKWADSEEFEETLANDHNDNVDRHRVIENSRDNTTIIYPEGEINLFPLLNNEAPFLVGVKGRNISLIRKYSGMGIYIKSDMVTMTCQRSRASPELAWRMVLSACYGGILRWFETPNATKKGYPEEKKADLESLAMKYGCSLDLLRSKRGHMCLMLIPQLNVGEDYRPDLHDFEDMKGKVKEAREALLVALEPATSAAA